MKLMNYKSKLGVAAIIPAILVLLIVIPNNVEALELNTEYFIDSPNAFVIIGVDSSGKTTILEGGVVVNDEWEYWTTETLKISRISCEFSTHCLRFPGIFSICWSTITNFYTKNTLSSGTKDSRERC